MLTPKRSPKRSPKWAEKSMAWILEDRLVFGGIQNAIACVFEQLKERIFGIFYLSLAEI